MDQFKDIRPYHDLEIRPVLDRLISNPEFLDSVASFYFPRLTRLLPAMMRAAAARQRFAAGAITGLELGEELAAYREVLKL